MTGCKNLMIKDVTSWHGDVFDHPTYEYRCRLNGRKVYPLTHCKSPRCEKYEPVNEMTNGESGGN